ncbi:hypothetical protein CCACVL1_07236, partial [Corchorus capsularis]
RFTSSPKLQRRPRSLLLSRSPANQVPTNPTPKSYT